MRKKLGQEFSDARESIDQIGNRQSSWTPPRLKEPVPDRAEQPRLTDKEYAQSIAGEPRVGNEPMTHDVHVGDTVNMPKGDCFEVTQQECDDDES